MADSQNIKKNLLEAQLYMQEGKVDEALKSLQEILNVQPDSVDALRYLGLSYVQKQQYAEAIAAFKHAIRIENNPILQMNIANVYKILNQHTEAIQHYTNAITINPKYAKAHNNLAGLYADLQRTHSSDLQKCSHEYNKALYHYKEAIHADPGFTLAHLNLGIFLFKNHQIAPAITQFKNVLAIDERNLMALFYLGLISLAEEDLAKAFAMFQQVLIIDAEHIEALVNSGVVCLKQKQLQLAIDYFTKALALDENNVEARNNLAATFIHNDRYENALKYYYSLLKDEPNNLEYLYNTGIAEMGLGRIDAAVNMFSKVLSINDKHFGALSNFAAIKMRNHDKKGAIELLQKALSVAPNNKTTKFMLQALLEKDVETCSDYVKDLFDHYALYYDKHMQETLQYKLPEKLWSILHELKFQNINAVLDLGCGTGLCGDVLQTFSKHLTGVDISDKMLAIAANKGVYETLILMDIMEFLRTNTNRYDLIVCLDVLPYFSSLAEVFNLIGKSLNKDGRFVFTTEISEHNPWQIQESLRFKHSPQYIIDLCAENNFWLEYQEQVPARKQDNSDLEEMFYIILHV